MKIVVTGALGHIGSRLIRSLPEAFPQAEFVLIDNMSCERYCSLFDLPARYRYRFIEDDLLTMNLKPHVSGADAVVHLGAITNAAGSFDIKEKLESHNFNATRRVAEAAAEQGAAVLFASTTSVYGTQKERVDEACSEDELKPQSPYAETKLKEERLLTDMGAAGLRFITCRFGTIFGKSPGMRFHTAVNKFCWQAVSGAPLTIWETAYRQKRPYLDLEDAVRAVAFILGKKLFDGEIYNVLTLNATVSDIVEAIKTRLPEVRVSFVKHEIMNQLSYDVACEKFKGLGFEFRGDLQRGVSETVELLRASNGRQERSNV